MRRPSILLFIAIAMGARAGVPPAESVVRRGLTAAVGGLRQAAVVTSGSRTSRRSFFGPALRLRGGRSSDSSDGGEEEVEVESDEEDGFDDVSADDFDGEATLMKRVKTMVERTPPVTQLFLSASIAVTVLSAILNENRFPSVLLLDWSKVATGQVWRLLTAFLYFGPLDFSFALTVQFVVQYMSQLEKVPLP